MRTPIGVARTAAAHAMNWACAAVVVGPVGAFGLDWLSCAFPGSPSNLPVHLNTLSALDSIAQVHKCEWFEWRSMQGLHITST